MVEGPLRLLATYFIIYRRFHGSFAENVSDCPFCFQRLVKNRFPIFRHNLRTESRHRPVLAFCIPQHGKLINRTQRHEATSLRRIQMLLVIQPMCPVLNRLLIQIEQIIDMSSANPHHFVALSYHPDHVLRLLSRLFANRSFLHLLLGTGLL